MYLGAAGPVYGRFGQEYLTLNTPTLGEVGEGNDNSCLCFRVPFCHRAGKFYYRLYYEL